MILRSIQLEGWRCFLAPVTLGPLGRGLNIVYGPNGSGKSTVMWALVRALFDNHTVSGDAIRSIRPWGRALTPRVSVEFEHGDQSYRIRKQFLDSPSSDLARLESGQWMPWANGRAADTQLRELLAAEPPSKGLSEQRHWGMAQVLWVPQGDLALQGLSASARATIEQAIGTELANPANDALEQRIVQEFGRYFTPKGSLRSGQSAPRLVGLQRLLQIKQTELGAQQSLVAEFDSLCRQIEVLNERLRTAKSTEDDSEQLLAETRQKAIEFSELHNQQSLLKRDCEDAQRRCSEIDARIHQLALVRQEIVQLTSALTESQAQLPDMQQQLSECRRRLEAAEQSMVALQQQQAALAELRNHVHAANRWTTARQRMDSLRSSAAKIADADDALQRARKEYDACQAPSEAQLAEFRRLTGLCNQARLRLEAAAITLRVTPSVRSLNANLVRGEPAGPLEMPAGVTQQFLGDPDVVLDLPGLGRIEASGPTTDIAALRRQLQDVDAQLATATAELGSGDLGLLQSQATRKASLAARVAQAEAVRRALLSDTTPEEIAAELDRLHLTIQQIQQTQVTWSQSPPDIAGLTAQLAESESRHQEEFARVETDRQHAQRDFDTVQTKLMELNVQKQQLQSRWDALQQRRCEFEADNLNDLQRASQRTEWTIKRDACTAQLAMLEEKLKVFSQDPRTTLAALEQKQKAARLAAEQADRDLVRAQSRLDELVNLAPYSRAAAMEAEINDLRATVEGDQLHLNAIQLLHETLVSVKKETVGRVLEPIRQRAHRLLNRIATAPMASVHLDGGLHPRGLSIPEVKEPIGLEEISGGEREQLHLSVRLAMADVVFGSERQLVVLDDVLTYTDTQRLARVVKILKEFAERFQILLLTCHPERYPQDDAVQRFDLQQIVLQSHRENVHA